MWREATTYDLGLNGQCNLGGEGEEEWVNCIFTGHCIHSGTKETLLQVCFSYDGFGEMYEMKELKNCRIKNYE